MLTPNEKLTLLAEQSSRCAQLSGSAHIAEKDGVYEADIFERRYLCAVCRAFAEKTRHIFLFFSKSVYPVHD